MLSPKQLRKTIVWKDLQKLSRAQVIYNVLLPYPLLILSFYFANSGNYFFALACSALFFSASFRQAHDGFHQTLGVSRRATDIILILSSALIISSNHAIRRTHLEHHRAPLEESDVEARFYQLKWYQAILGGAPLWFSLQKYGYQLANHTDRPKILAEFTLMAFMVLLAIFSQNTLLMYHVLIMVVGNSFVGFVAGWLVHHDCDEEVIARTERNPVVNLLTFDLLYHQEHHLFPSVPTNNLSRLAKRIDAVEPELTRLKVVTLPELSKKSNKSRDFFKPIFDIDLIKPLKPIK